LGGADGKNYVVTSYGAAPYINTERNGDSPSISAFSSPEPSGFDQTAVYRQEPGYRFGSSDESEGGYKSADKHESGGNSNSDGQHGNHEHSHEHGAHNEHGHNGENGHEEGNENEHPAPDDINNLPPGLIEAAIWFDPQPYVAPVLPIEIVRNNPNQAPVDLDSSLTQSLYNPSANTTISGGFTSAQSLGSVTIPKGTGIEVVVPKATFQHSNPDAKLTYSATLENGDPLPEWLSFDPATQTVKGTPPNGQSGNVVVKVIATDEVGDKATTSLNINY